ncbi:MAG: NfeD family protein [Dehalococcoidales bacterium]|nr:NfeD family protein [Dehalococcoidales bacterium]
MRLLLNPWILTLIIIVMIAFIVFVVYKAIGVHKKQVAAGREELIGRTGVVQTALSPRGMVLVEGEGELWTAILDKGSANPGEEVIVTGVEGLKLRVARKKEGGSN